MEPHQLLVGGLACARERVRPERANEVDARPEAARRERMARPEVVLPQSLVPDDDRLAREPVSVTARLPGAGRDRLGEGDLGRHAPVDAHGVRRDERLERLRVGDLPVIAVGLARGRARAGTIAPATASVTSSADPTTAMTLAPW